MSPFEFVVTELQADNQGDQIRWLFTLAGL
jgi:hypothetical protein